MLRRLILLLTLMLAFPAAAQPACHAPTAPIVQSMHHGSATHHAAAREDAAMLHDCIGCIPPGNLLAAPLAEPIVPRVALSALPPSALLRRAALAPTPPPPRAG